MYKLTKRITVIALLMLMAASSLCLAQGRQGRMPPPPPDPALGMVSQALRSLDLTEDQRDQIRETVQGHMQGELGTLVETQIEVGKALETAVWSADTSEQEVADAFQAAAESGEALSQARHQLALDILDVLTQEQQTALQQMIEQGPGQFGGQGGRRGPGGPRGSGGPGGFEGQNPPGR